MRSGGEMTSGTTWVWVVVACGVFEEDPYHISCISKLRNCISFFGSADGRAHEPREGGNHLPIGLGSRG